MSILAIEKAASGVLETNLQALVQNADLHIGTSPELDSYF